MLTPEQWVARALADAPPLRDDQRVKLAELLRPVRRSQPLIVQSVGVEHPATLADRLHGEPHEDRDDSA